MKKFQSKIVVVFVMLAMTICFAAASAQADDGSNGTQGGTLSTGAPPPAPPAPVRMEIDWYFLLMMMIMFGRF